MEDTVPVVYAVVGFLVAIVLSLTLFARSGPAVDEADIEPGDDESAGVVNPWGWG